MENSKGSLPKGSWYPHKWDKASGSHKANMSTWSKENKTYTIMGNVVKFPAPTRKRPLVLLFDIGGVCVVSPFQSILDYEKSKGIPLGFINWTISQTNPSGAWQKLERGEIPLDHTFYDEWKSDIMNERRWREYHARQQAEQRKEQKSDAAEEVAFNAPPIPDIDTEWLHNEMMANARQLDPHMGPAIKRLRQHADQSNGKIIIGALSNTSIFPPGHKLYDATSVDGKASKGLEGIFDVFVSSAHVGMRKPDEDIYRYAIVRLHEFVKTKQYGDGVKAEDIVFLDDIGTNLRTAKKLGMRTIKVKLGRADLAVKELEEATGLDLSRDKARL